MIPVVRSRLRLRQSAVLACLGLLLGGCASTDGYRQFFRPNPSINPDDIAARRVTPPGTAPRMERADEISPVFARQGYALLGYSAFTSGRRPSDKAAVTQGARLGADLVVLISPKYDRTVRTSIPLATPTTSTSHTTGSATAYGSGGSATAYGNATTTTYGTQTTYMPMSIDRYEYGAFYYVKIRYSFGALLRDLTDAERQKFQTNRGAVVNVVVDASPAYENDVLPGDVVVSVNGQSANGAQGLISLINAHRGEAVDVGILRNGSQISKHLTLLE